jgi:predicted DNA-binding transcriptional regulator YafY
VLNPKITGPSTAGDLTAAFDLADNIYFCKQIFSFGGNAEILEPQQLRNLMADMCRKTLSVYEK